MERIQKPLLEVSDLSVSFRMYDSGLEQKQLPVISSLSLKVLPGEILAVAGSSGSGKSLLASAILGILPGNATVSGSLRFDGEPLTPERQAKLRGTEIALVPQSVAFLDPLMKVGAQVDGHRKPRPTERRRKLFRRFGLPEQTERLYPFQLSGGMARRVLISTAVAASPALVIADEPTPGLDVRAAARILGHFRELSDAGAGVLLITHDLELALTIADKVAVFYAGETVEEAPAGDFDRLEDLRHPYTRALWRALPQHGFHPIPGTQPYPGALPEGCPFAPRCPKRTAECSGEVPYRPLDGGFVRCLHPERGNAS